MNGHRLFPNVRWSRKISHRNAGFWMYRGAEKMFASFNSFATAAGPPGITAGSTSTLYFQKLCSESGVRCGTLMPGVPSISWSIRRAAAARAATTPASFGSWATAHAACNSLMREFRLRK